MDFHRYVALGDSFTEGYGDPDLAPLPPVDRPLVSRSGQVRENLPAPVVPRVLSPGGE